MKRSCTLILLLLMILSEFVAAQTPAPVVPDFTFYRLDGKPFSAKQMPAGKPSVFSFFDVTCSHCQTTMKLLSSHHADLKSPGVYLMNLDQKDAAIKFLNLYGANLLNKDNVVVLQDVKYEFIPKFRPLKYPSVFLYNKNRKLVVYEKDDKRMMDVIKKLKALK